MYELIKMTNPSLQQLTEHSLTFLMIVLFAYVSVLFENQWAVNIDLVGGAVLLSYILFSLRMMPSVILAIVVSMLIFKQQGNILALESAMMVFTCTIGPATALFIMSSAKKIHISTLRSITFKQVLILTFIQAIFCSMLKLFTAITINSNVTQPEIADYFLKLFTIDSLGTLAIVYAAIKIITYFKKVNPSISTA